MPELPEVENVCRTLKQDILNKEIKDLWTDYPKMLNLDFDSFLSSLVGKKILDIFRYGKFIIIKLNFDLYLMFHLRMEGKLFYMMEEEYPYLHFKIKFSDSSNLLFCDMRKFGRVYLKKSSELFTTLPLVRVQKDPFKISLDEFYLNLKKTNKPVKEALLDQSIVSGIGNIYADEILYKVGLSPLMKSKNISKECANKILFESRRILSKAILFNGTTIKSFKSSATHSGGYQDFLICHNEAICMKCSAPLTKIKIGGRTTYYCKNCQKKKNQPFKELERIVVGITGSIACGKSYVVSKLPYDIIDTDKISKEIYLKGHPAYLSVKKAFPMTVLDDEISRKKLGEIIFNDLKSKELLNQIVHPFILNEVLKKIEESKTKFVFIDVPLLFESGFDKICDVSVCVYTTPENQIKRLMNRDGIDLEYALKKINSQMPLNLKVKKSDYVIISDEDFNKTNENINYFLNLLEKEIKNA